MVLFEILYLAVIASIALYGVHRFWLIFGSIRSARRAREEPPSLPAGEKLPRVLIQLPLYNEGMIIYPLIRSAASVDWDRARLEIQVLDDSDDGSEEDVARAVRRFRVQGIPIRHIRRTVRKGYKAGALAEGLDESDAEFVAIFDADFLVPSSFLRRTVPCFQDPAIGMVQARWGFRNESRNLLTRIQAVLLDGHFHVEHRARSGAGRFFNFNGTAGVWRRRAIDEAGGWSADTVTEDLDLSLRAWLKGWRFRYLDDCVAKSELPEGMRALKVQQNRWVSGAVHTAVCHLGRVFQAPLRRREKLDIFFYLTGNACYPLMLLLALLVPPAIYLRLHSPRGAYLWADIPFLILATGSVVAFYGWARAGEGGGLGLFFGRIPALMALGLGMSLHNTRAVLKGLLGRSRVFERTPKAGSGLASGGSSIPQVSRRRGELLPWLEGLMTLYLLGFGLWTAAGGNFHSLPFIALIGGGYLWVFRHSRRARAA
ncbi:MAG: glycosyltransferase family 2 protein [Planctomycetota bacterium]